MPYDLCPNLDKYLFFFSLGKLYKIRGLGSALPLASSLSIYMGKTYKLIVILINSLSSNLSFLMLNKADVKVNRSTSLKVRNLFDRGLFSGKFLTYFNIPDESVLWLWGSLMKHSRNKIIDFLVVTYLNTL